MKKNKCEQPDEQAYKDFLTDQYLYNNRDISILSTTTTTFNSKWRLFFANTSSWRHFNLLPSIEFSWTGDRKYMDEIYWLTLSWLFFGTIISLEREQDGIPF